MSLVNLLKYLSANEKTEFLGEESTRILRYTFADKDTDAIPERILSEALAVKHGEDFISKSSYRNSLIESIPERILKRNGISDCEKAIKIYKKDINRFLRDFDIEDKYKPISIEDDRTDFEYSIPKYGECNGTNAFPHFYQLNLKDRVLYDIYNNYHNSILVTMPTGAGKTVLAMEVIIDFFRSNRNLDKKLHVGWFVSSKELCEQSFQSFQKLWKQKGDRRVRACRYWGKFNNLDSRIEDKITFGGFPLLISRLNEDSLKDYLSTIDLLVIDEAHGVKADSRDRLIAMYKNLRGDIFQIIGLTATPFRLDDEEYDSLKGSFQKHFEIRDENNNPVNSPIQYLVDNEFLASLKFEKLNSVIGSSKSEYYGNLHASIIQECRNLLSSNKNVIIFAESYSHAISLNIYLQNNGIENALIIGDTPPNKRKKYLQEFGDPESSLNVLVNESILSTGIDVPGMNAIMVLRDIGSPTLAMQILGRAMRGPKNGGNLINRVYLTDSNYTHLKNYKLIEQKVLKS
jgi:superfamily II DNA or RNA helicase